MELSSEINLYASHRDFVQTTVNRLGAHWWMAPSSFFSHNKCNQLKLQIVAGEVGAVGELRNSEVNVVGGWWVVVLVVWEDPKKVRLGVCCFLLSLNLFRSRPSRPCQWILVLINTYYIFWTIYKGLHCTLKIWSEGVDPNSLHLHSTVNNISFIYLIKLLSYIQYLLQSWKK